MNKRVFLVLLLTVLLSFPNIVVQANVPSVISITRRTVGSNLIIDVKVSHSDPSSSHYIAQINLDLDGASRSFTGFTPATTVEATYSCNITSINPKAVKAQAVCNVHGAGAFYTEGGTGSGGGIPAYPNEAIALGILAITVILMNATKKH
jgi:desulfoferrodoxin (superoxide reductase-like protein)